MAGLMAAGCATDAGRSAASVDLAEVDAGQATSHFAPGESALPQPFIRRRSAEGSLCPRETSSFGVTNEGQQLDFSFGTLLDGDEQREPEASCRVSMQVEVPAGYALGNPSLYLAPSGWGPLEITTEYSLGGASAGPNTFVFDPEHQRSVFDRPKNLWSDTCGDPSRSHVVELAVDITTRVPTGASFSSILASFDLSPRGGRVEFRRCADDRPIDPPGAEAGSLCDDRERRCAEGLRCELNDSARHVPGEARRGVCVDPDELESASAPQQAGAGCGGPRALRCDTGLVCHYTGEAARRDQLLGQCTPAVGAEGDRCEGEPAVPCGDGLHCYATNPSAAVKYCRYADGSEEATCGPGLPPCDPGLACTTMVGRSVCKTKFVGTGQPCGEGVATCIGADICDPSSRTCVTPTGLGELEAFCSPELPCRPELECRARRCREPLTGKLGSPCAGNDQCEPGLDCKNSQCVVPGALPSGAACTSSDECQPGLSCLLGACSYRSDGTLGAQCRIDAQCDDDLLCIDQLCSVPETTGDLR